MLGFMPLSFPPRKRGPRSRDGAAATARTSAQRAFCQHDAQALLKKQHPPCHGGHSGLMSFWLPSRARRSLGPGVRRENENNPPPCCPLRFPPEKRGPRAGVGAAPQPGTQRRQPFARNKLGALSKG